MARPWLLLQIANAAWAELVFEPVGPVWRTSARASTPAPCAGAMRESVGDAWNGEPVDDFEREHCALIRASLETILREHPASEIAGTALDRLAGLWLDAGFPTRAERCLMAYGADTGAAVATWSQWVAIADAYARSERRGDERRCLDRALPLAATPAARAQVEYRFGLRRLAAQDFPAALRAFESSAEGARAAPGDVPGTAIGHIAVGAGLALARIQLSAPSWSPSEAWERLARVATRWSAWEGFEAMLIDFVHAGRFDWALAGYEYRSREEGSAMSPRHAWVVAMASPRADAVERLSTWVRTGRRGGDVAAATVLEIAGRWHRESLDRDPRDGEHLRDAIQLYQSIMEAARHHASDRGPYPAEVDAARYHAEALCALRAIGGP